MLQEKLERINFLSRKAKEEGLTETEKVEQRDLRSEYLAEWKKGVEQTLDNTYIVDPDGNKTKLKKRD